MQFQRKGITIREMRKYSGHEKELIGEFFLDLEILTADEIEKILQNLRRADEPRIEPLRKLSCFDFTSVDV